MKQQHARLIKAMTDYDGSDAPRIQHFIKVHDFAVTIAQLEGIDEPTLFVLETASILHDIGIHESERIYGNCLGKHQEELGPEEARQMLTKLGGYSEEQIARVCFLIAHHHTYSDVKGIDWQILLEADFLVNAFEDNLSRESIKSFGQKVFKTKTGKHLLKTMFGLEADSTGKITMLGTGHATVTRCYNTCFILQSAKCKLLVDAGGGNGILSQLQKAETSITDIHNLYVTHAHTDHILGVIWVIRMVASNKKYEGQLHVYSHDKALTVIKTILDMTLSKKNLAKVDERVVYHEIKDGDCIQLDDIKLTCFDIHSTKEKQFGFRAEFADGTVVACLGDEPFNPLNRALVEHADWLMSEAFCLYADKDVFKPYEKCHSTALDAGKLAAELGAKNLILYHTEDKTLDTRRQNYTSEAAKNFKGNIFVPDDLEEILL